MTVATIAKTGAVNPATDVNHIIPLIAEQIDAEIRTVETGRVQLKTRVVETQQVVELQLQRDDVEIERIRLDQVVEQVVPIREEDGVTIISLYEERLVVTKQLVLKEELHLRRRSSVQLSEPQHVTLRHEEVTITRHPASPLTDHFEPVERQ